MEMWDAVAARGSEVSFSAGAILLHHGDHGQTCYAICRGEVLVTATSTQGATVVLGRRGRGALIGELGMWDGLPRTATVRATTDVVAVALSAPQLEGLLREEPDLAVAEIRRLARQVRDLTERYAMRGEELRMRIVQLLETHARESGDPVFRSTREELAGWVGATREATSRALRDLEASGRVTLSRSAVELVR
jgi:CRP-like cAMP-binding protein